MRIIAACTSYWHNQAEFDARYNGVWLNPVDPLTGNHVLTLHPDYKGRFGLRNWHESMQRLFSPIACVIACGTWSPPELSRFGSLVTVVNGGANPDHPHTNGWQYMGCALTALMAHLCNRRDWDVCVFLEPDLLLGAVDWDALLREFLARPEEVMGPAWYAVHCDFIAYKPRAALRYLHQRLRPNLSEAPDADTALPWLDHEHHQLWAEPGLAWNPWPDVRTIRQDALWPASQWEGCPTNVEVLTWPFVRMPDPALIDEYLRTQTAHAKSVVAP